MNSRNKPRKGWLALATTLLITAGASQAWAVAQNTKGEGKCHATIAKSLSKHIATITKAMSKCENAVLAGDISGPCPDTKAEATIDKSSEKVIKSLSKKCSSQCSVSGVDCIGSSVCPPNGELTENCTAGGKNFFEFSNMSFPGPYCEGLLGHPMVLPADFGDCADELGDILALNLLENIYGSLNAPPATGQKCLDTIAKQVPKAAGKLAQTVSKCRAKQLTSDPPDLLADNCATQDTKTADSITKILTKVDDAIAKACTDTMIGELDLCGNGIGGTPDVASAQACLGEMLTEISYSIENAEDRTYASVSIINGAYPSTAAARCGDDVINQLPSQFLLNGEECDGISLGDCDACLPPGDVFECTCAEKRRSRAFADGFAADLDNGWSGASHNSKVTDGAGFVADVDPSSCDCDAFTGATCTGTSGDTVCDISAPLQPRCSHRLDETFNCDQAGNDSNTSNGDNDCWACDVYTTNSGDYCTGAARFCVGGANDGVRCNLDSDCPGGACNGIGRCSAGPFQGNGCAGPQNCRACLGGVNVNLSCSTNGDCPLSTCGYGTAADGCQSDICFGGANDGQSCDAADDCPGGRCAETSDCGSQCYDADGLATGEPCWRQADCDTAAGERCQGRCDKDNYCLILRNGAPLPLSSEGTSVCIDSRFATNMIGTRDIVTGEHAINYDLRSVTVLADTLNSSPCPVCGGWCAETGSQLDRTRCDGVCSGTETECRYGPNKGAGCVDNTDCADFLCGPVRCRFDEDCPSGTCSGTDSPDCQGGDCRLDLSCNLGPNKDKPCRIEAYTAFGTTSADCPPQTASLNVSGEGLAISWTPLTSEAVVLEQPAPCNAEGYENYECNCVFGTGLTRNRPNKCQPACDAGANYGESCPDLTKCVGGANNNKACDEDTDCPGGACSGNPGICGDGNTGICSVGTCAGGPNAGVICSTDGPCIASFCDIPSCTVGGVPCTNGFCEPDACPTIGLGCTDGGTCEDACPTGRCTPLCVTRGLCNGGLRDGQKCALDPDCLGGTCVPDDVAEGACAQGAFNHCDGPGWEFVSCAPNQVGTKAGCEWGTDTIEGNANDNVGAGFCVADISNCFINDGAAEGGDTLNGNGDPTNAYSVATYCIPASTSSAVNSTAGLPGPGRIRQPSVVITNFTELP